MLGHYRIFNARDQEKEILNGKQIIATTNLKVLTSIFDDLHFDLAIMDEAGFTDLPAALGPFVKANKLILIGDHKQLQPIIQERWDFENHVQQYPFIKKSIFELFWKRRQSENKGIMLNKQYRMKEVIASFISNEFYDGLLETGLIEERSNLNDAEDSIISFRCPLVFININAWEAREWNSWFCAGEIELVKRVVKKFAEEHEGRGIYDKIGVITPFRPQSNRMKDKIPKEVACGTVHVFQGHEKPIVICSTVRQTERGRRSLPLLDERLLNVAVSRAMHKFILLGNKNVLCQIPHYRALIEHAEQYGVVYEEIPEGYDYTNRCEYCGRPIEKRYGFCAACRNAVEHERDRGGLIRFIDGIIVRSRGNIPTVDGHWVRSEGEKKIDNCFHENRINHRYEEYVKKYLFRLAEQFEKDLNEGTISRGLRSIFRRNDISLSEDAVITRRREEDKWEIADYRDGETYSIEKERRELKIYKKARIPMWCDWYLPDYDIYVEYWGMVEDARYKRTRERKIREYNRLPLKLLSLEREDLSHLDRRLRDKLQDLGINRMINNTRG